MRYILFIPLIIFGCAGIQQSALNDHINDFEKTLNHHSGLVLYDLEKEKIVYDHNGDRYFTPASNVKLLTFYTSLKTLEDSLITFAYQQKNDSAILWPVGDPAFLNPEFTRSNVIHKLDTISGDIYLSFSHSDVEHFGPGWSWDDYRSYYSVERSALPLYGNYYSVGESQNSLSISVPHFKEYLWLSDSIHRTRFIRDLSSNSTFYYPGNDRRQDQTKIPFKTSPWLSTLLLSDTLGRRVYTADIPIDTTAKLIKSLPLDTAYKKMMHESNNFVAEQLLLQCSFVLFDTLDAEKTIEYALEHYLQDLPHQPIWKDGSGLSRYNLITPLSTVFLLKKLIDEHPREELFPYLATGGKFGTLKNYYQAEPPYIYGKTGTLSNNHNLSGYLISRKGKIFIFSFMNNNYPTSSSSVKKYMEEILWEIHLNN